jgi:O-antigen/teichoic acid export membrane protein
MSDGLKQKATKAFAWAFAKSWAVKVFSLLVFFVLARVLSPEDMGVAQVVTLVLALIAVFGELGLPAALVQHKGLRAQDVNLPFYLAVGIAALSSIGLLTLAAPVAQMLGAPRAEPLLKLAAIAPPLTAASAVLMALRKRELDFASIARASVVASLLAGVSALLLAWLGFGPLALVVQALVIAAVTMLLLWHRSEWRPTLSLDTSAFRALLGFSGFAFASALIDFFSNRIMDFMIAGRFGAAMLGVYAVGAKLYLTMLELLASTLTDVGASMMARLRGDAERLRRVHLRLLFLGSCSTSAVFVLMAALAPELCAILFGAKWADAAPVAAALGLLGGVQVVQFFNGALLLATGHSASVFVINICKFALSVLAVVVLPADGIGEVAMHFVLAQLLVSPLSFGLAAKVTGARPIEMLQSLWPGWLGCALAFAATWFAREALSEVSLVFRFLALGVCFAIVFVVVVGVLRGRRLKDELTDLWRSRRAQPSPN